MTKATVKKTKAKAKTTRKTPSIQVFGGLENKYYMVPLLDIHVVERPEEGHESEQYFYNARNLESMDSESMRELRDNIAQTGLHNPLIVRAITDDDDVVHIDLIAGERRLRSLLKLYEDNTLVYDWREQKKKSEKSVKSESPPMRPAREVYSHIPCEIWYDITDEKMLSLSVAENLLRKDFSIQEQIDLVERLVKRGVGQQQIATDLGSNITWVSQTYNFRRELPSAGFERLLDGRMTRNVAVDILKYHKGEDRIRLLNETIHIEQADSLIAKKKAQRAVEDAEDDEEIVKSAAKKANPEKTPQFKKKLAVAARKIVDAKAKQDKVEAEAGTIRQGHLQQGAVAAGVSPRTARVLTKSMIQQFDIDVPNKWIEINKIDPIVHKPYPVDKLMVIVETAHAVLSGNIDTGAIVRKVMVKLGEWELPKGVYEKDPELLEIKDDDEELG